MRALAVALACASVWAVSGCGGDEEATPAERAPLPKVTQPAPDTSRETVRPAPAPAPQAPPAEEQQGGASAPAPVPAPDSPENDVPPPEGSPAERFEQFCAENPGACGQ